MKIEEKTKGVIVKLGASKKPEYPDSSAGNTPHNGVFFDKPVVGKSFLMDCGNMFFKTSFIVEIISETDNEIIFETNNSRYQLRVNLLDVI